MRLRLSVLRAVALLAACSSAAACHDNRDPLGPEPGPRPAFDETFGPSPELQFLTWGPGGPPLGSMVSSVLARRGESSRLTVSYERYYGDSEEFLRLDMQDESLFLRPNGTPFRNGDSVQIKAVMHPVKLMVTFSPAGLVFNPGEPPELRIRYHGAVTSQIAPAAGIQLWRQEGPGQPWLRVRSVQFDGTEIRTRVDLGGFTRFALAIGR